MPVPTLLWCRERSCPVRSAIVQVTRQASGETRMGAQASLAPERSLHLCLPVPHRSLLEDSTLCEGLEGFPAVTEVSTVFLCPLLFQLHR